MWPIDQLYIELGEWASLACWRPAFGLSLEFMEFSLRILLNPVPTRLCHVIYCCWFSIIWQNVTKTEGHEMMRSNFHDRFTIIPHMNYGVSPKFQFLLNSTLKRCQTQSLVWWWLDQKGANSPNILHSHLYWHPTIHSCLAKISWSGFEHGSNADDNHCTLLIFFPISKRYQQTRNTTT